MNKKVKVIVTVPVTHADAVRKALGDAGAGIFGNYKHCSFSVVGIGRFLPTKGAHPAIGKIGVLETVVEEQIESICLKKDMKRIDTVIRAAHPYEEPGIEFIELLEIENGI